MEELAEIFLKLSDKEEKKVDLFFGERKEVCDRLDLVEIFGSRLLSLVKEKERSGEVLCEHELMLNDS